RANSAGLPPPPSCPAPESAAPAPPRRSSPPPGPALQYSAAQGLPELREWIAAQATAQRGQRVDPSQVIVTAGALQALDVVSKALIDPGDVIAIDDPAFPASLHCLRMYQPEVLAVDVDDNGMDVETLAERLEGGHRPKLVYTVATCHNPTGATMTVPRRIRLAQLAERYGFAVVEDDPYSALRFRGEPVPPISAYSDRVLTLGSFSKTLGPGLRIGWVIAPPSLAEPITRAKRWSDLHTSTFVQATLLELLDQAGWWDAHVATLPGIYRERCAALRSAVAAHLGGVLEVNDPAGGLFVWGRIVAAGISADDLLDAAVQRGVSFVSGPQFAVHRPDPATLRLSFAGHPPERLDLAVRRLAEAAASLVG
ncbi:MAG: PLP-dependent aminotransferase family protein, partial [Frankia sp.]